MHPQKQAPTELVPKNGEGAHGPCLAEPPTAGTGGGSCAGCLNRSARPRLAHRGRADGSDDPPASRPSHCRPSSKGDSWEADERLRLLKTICSCGVTGGDGLGVAAHAGSAGVGGSRAVLCGLPRLPLIETKNRLTLAFWGDDPCAEAKPSVSIRNRSPISALPNRRSPTRRRSNGLHALRISTKRTTGTGASKQCSASLVNQAHRATAMTVLAILAAVALIWWVTVGRRRR
jgi:hypothetical protein